MVAAEGAHTPFEIVHTNLLIPTLREVTAVENVKGDVSAAGPESEVQTPLPTTGELAEIVAEEAHTVCEGPVSAASGNASTVTVSVLEGYMHAAPAYSTLR